MVFMFTVATISESYLYLYLHDLCVFFVCVLCIFYDLCVYGPSACNKTDDDDDDDKVHKMPILCYTIKFFSVLH